MKKYFKGIGLVLVGFGITLGLMYVDNKSKVLNESEIKNSKQMAIMIEEDGEYKESKIIPKTGYKYNEEKSYCNNGAKPTWNSVTNSLKLSNLTKDKTSCILYFNKKLTKTSEEVLADLGRTVTTEEPDFSKIDTKEYLDENGKSKMFKTEDDFGESYYFRGKVKDNWVKFGTDEKEEPIWWRIIRINGDGSIRLIYAGTGTDATNLTTDDGYTGNSNSQINSNAKYAFNTERDNSKYVGYFYGSSNNGNLHTSNDNPSNVYTEVNSWFEANLNDEWNSGNGQIDENEGFCGDRSNNSNRNYPWTESMLDIYPNAGANQTFCGAYLRLHNNKQPTYKCGTTNNKNNDLYTYTGAEGVVQKGTNVTIKGNQKLEYPVGLITLDDTYYAGGYSAENRLYFLYSNTAYWTMSPSGFNSSSSRAFMFSVNAGGSFGEINVGNTSGLRPVINIKSVTEFKTEADSEHSPGTINNPYVVVD